MKSKSKVVLESKLKVYLTCYQEAEKRHDQKRMDSLVSYIDDLRDEIHELK